MSTTRTAYHVIFYRLLKDRGPAGFSFQFEQPLTVDLQRADLIIVRKINSTEVGPGVVLPWLWPLLPQDSIAEYKSPTGGFRPGDLARLLGYAGQYHSEHIARIPRAREFALVLVVASMTPTLEDELAAFAWTVRPIGRGYYRTDAQPYPLYVVLVDEVAEAERDVLLDVVGHRRMQSSEADLWLVKHWFSSLEEPGMEKLEGYDELVEKALANMSTALRVRGIPQEELLKDIPLKKRLEGIPPKEWAETLPLDARMEGLTPEQQILALHNDVLATLPQSYVDTLPEAVRAEIRRRLNH